MHAASAARSLHAALLVSACLINSAGAAGGNTATQTLTESHSVTTSASQSATASASETHTITLPTATDTDTYTMTMPTGTETFSLPAATETTTLTLPTGTETVTLPTLTETSSISYQRTMSQSLRLPPTTRFYEGFDAAGNESLADVLPGYASTRDTLTWVDPPYSLRIDGSVGRLQFGETGVFEPRAVSWWFYLPRGTNAVHFYLSSTYNRLFEGYEPFRNFHVRASVEEGLYVESELTGVACGVNKQGYSVLQDTWHQLALEIDYHGGDTPELYRNSTHLAASLALSLDGARLCDGILWNYTSVVLKQLHVAPVAVNQEAWCANMTQNATCNTQAPLQSLSATPYGGGTPCFSARHTDGSERTDVEKEALCLTCCRQRSLADMSEGCCQYDIRADACLFAPRVHGDDAWLSRNYSTFHDTRLRYLNASSNGYEWVNVSNDLSFHKASGCSLEDGRVYVDRVNVCDTKGHACDHYASVRPFNCSQYNSYPLVSVADEQLEGPDFNCRMHPRCHFHAAAQVCVEDALSELRGAWNETQAGDLVYASEALIWRAFQSVGENGWQNVSTAGGIATADGGSPITHKVAILRSPEFVVGWATEIELFVNSSDASVATKGLHDLRGPADANQSAIDRGFLGAAIQWNGAWVFSKRVCVGTCSFVLSATELRPFLHQTVTLDIVDMDLGRGGGGAFSLRGVTIVKPAEAVPGFLPNWGLGRPCGGPVQTDTSTATNSHWQGVVCGSDGGVLTTELTELDLRATQLKGDVAVLDLSMYGNLTRLDVSENELNGTIDDTMLPYPLANFSIAYNPLASPLPSFYNLQRLENLNFSATSVYGELPARWFERADLSGSVVYHSPYALRSVDVDNTAVSGTLPPEIARHPTLEVLRAYGCMLTGDIPNPLGASLRNLELSGNTLTGVAPFREYTGTGVVDNVGLASNSLVGIIPDWIRHARAFSLSGNSWCCPIPHWARAPAPFYAPARPRSLAWAREEPLHTAIPACTTVGLDQPGAVFGVCPTVVGTCDGTITCGHQRCECEMTAPAYVDMDVPTYKGESDRKCPTYDGCGCDMRRLRCVYRPTRPTCNTTTWEHNAGVCVDERHEFDQTPHPQHNPYYSDVGIYHP